MARNQSRMPLPPKAVVDQHPELEPQPVHDLDGHPELDAADESMPEEVVIPKPVSKKKLKVTANRFGFIHQERKNPGDKFEVMERELGSWMDCDDPVEQKKHLARLVEKNRKVNKQAEKEQEEELAADE